MVLTLSTETKMLLRFCCPSKAGAVATPAGLDPANTDKTPVLASTPHSPSICIISRHPGLVSGFFTFCRNELVGGGRKEGFVGSREEEWGGAKEKVKTGCPPPLAP